MGIGNLGLSEILLLAVIVLLFFGPRRLPEIGRSVGKALREFKRGMNEVRRELDDVERSIGGEEGRRPPSGPVRPPGERPEGPPEGRRTPPDDGPGAGPTDDASAESRGPAGSDEPPDDGPTKSDEADEPTTGGGE